VIKRVIWAYCVLLGANIFDLNQIKLCLHLLWQASSRLCCIKPTSQAKKNGSRKQKNGVIALFLDAASFINLRLIPLRHYHTGN